MYTALTIAGSDSSGGAGIQADIKTMTVNGVFAMSAVTALTAQNTCGVSDIMEASADFLAKEIDAVFTDIRPDAVKTGMVASSDLIEVIADRLTHYGAGHIVTDPVMVATSGARLIAEDAVATLEAKLIPLAELITPNIPEAEVLAEMDIRSKDAMEKAAEKIFAAYGAKSLIKGGHMTGNSADDYLYDGSTGTWFSGRRIANENTHGTGCTLSSAIAANLAKGYDLAASVRRAKDYLSGALAFGLDLGKGHGPMNHAYDIKSTYMEEA